MDKENIASAQLQVEDCDKILTSTTVDRYKQKTLDTIFRISSATKDLQMSKKRKTRSPISMLNIEELPLSDSMSDSDCAISDSDFQGNNEGKNQALNTVHPNWEQDAVIQSLTKTFCQQFDEFKAEVKGLIWKAQEEDKVLTNTFIAKVESLSDQLSKKDEEIKHLQLYLENCQLRTQFLDVDQQYEDLLQEKARSMKNNLILNNIRETENENIKNNFHDFFKMNLCIPEDEKRSTLSKDQLLFILVH